MASDPFVIGGTTQKAGTPNDYSGNINLLDNTNPAGGYKMDENGWQVPQWSDEQKKAASQPAKQTGDFTTGGSSSSSGGIISSQMKSPSMSAAIVSGPTQWSVTAPQTVQGQMNSLLDMNNPIIQQAMTQAKQQQVANGTQNSSLATTAGLNAAYNTVLPIANSDASTFAKSASYNADAQNQVNLANAQLKNQAGQANLQAETSLETTGMNNQTQLTNTKLNNETQLTNTKLNNDNQLAMQKIENDNRQLLDNNTTARTIYSNTTSAINNVMMSTTMSPEQKQIACQQIWANGQKQLSTLGKTSGLDLGSILGVNPYTPVEPTTEELTDKTKSPGPDYEWSESAQSWVKKAAPAPAPAPTNNADWLQT